MLSEKSLKLLVKEAKAEICVVCFQNIKGKENSAFAVLPCDCLVCSKPCFEYYFNLVFNKNKKDKKGTICICGYQFNTFDYKRLYEILDSKNLKDNKKVLELFVLANLCKTCIMCLEDIRVSQKEFHLLKLKDDEMTKLYKIKEFPHVICEECFELRRVKEKDNIECLLCNSTHKVDKIKKNMSQQKDSDCCIL